MTDMVCIPAATAVAVLIRLVGEYSEEYYAAGWHSGIDAILWRQVHTGDCGDHGTDCPVCVINTVAVAAGRWPVWDDTIGEPGTVPIADYAARHGTERDGVNPG